MISLYEAKLKQTTSKSAKNYYANENEKRRHVHRSVDTHEQMNKGRIKLSTPFLSIFSDTDDYLGWIWKWENKGISIVMAPELN